MQVDRGGFARAGSLRKPAVSKRVWGGGGRCVCVMGDAEMRVSREIYPAVLGALVGDGTT
jgi:hypothetical protein